jgi:predicted ABC-type ATPase
MPNLYIIAGHNGAGKSTFGKNLLPQNAQNITIFDGDLVYTQKLKYFSSYIKVHKYAAQEADDATVEEFERLSKEAIATQSDFAYEGHFSNENSWDTIRFFKKQGYAISMIFLGLKTLESSEKRVSDRVQANGFLVPAYAIHHNYYGNLKFLNIHHDLIDNLSIWDSTSGNPQILMVINNAKKEYQSTELPHWFTEFLPDLV